MKTKPMIKKLKNNKYAKISCMVYRDKNADYEMITFGNNTFPISDIPANFDTIEAKNYQELLLESCLSVCAVILLNKNYRKPNIFKKELEEIRIKLAKIFK